MQERGNTMKLMRLTTVAALFAFGLMFANCDTSDSDKDVAAVEEDVEAEDDVAGEAEDDVAGEPEEDVFVGCVAECDIIGKQACVDGNNYHVCVPDSNCLVWGDSIPCTEGQTCNVTTGMCEVGTACQDECITVGVKTCTNDAAGVMECQQGEDGCKKLVEIEICAGGKACENGECTTGGGGDDTDCLGIVKCSSTCTNQACVEGCAQQSSQAGIDAYNLMGTCAQQSCGAVLDKAAASQKCIVENCGAQWTGCVGPWGTNTCIGMTQCAQGCADGACQVDCLVSGSQAGQIALWGVQACLEANCGNCNPTDQQCLQTCAEQNCMNEMMACQTN